jgi:hypothetical protein
MSNEQNPDNLNEAIARAIDAGGGQSCDVIGILRELKRTGLKIVPDGFNVGISEQIYWPICRILRSVCRDFHFGELVEQGRTVGIYVLTPGVELGDEIKTDIGALMLKHGMPYRTKVSFFSQVDIAGESK